MGREDGIQVISRKKIYPKVHSTRDSIQCNQRLGETAQSSRTKKVMLWHKEGTIF